MSVCRLSGGRWNRRSRPLAAVRGFQLSGSCAAVADGGRQPADSRSRTHCSRSGAHAALSPAAGLRVLLTLPVIAMAARSTRPPTGSEHRPSRIERLLLLGSTGSHRPIGDIRGPVRRQRIAGRCPVRPMRQHLVLPPRRDTTSSMSSRSAQCRNWLLLAW